MIRKNAYFVQLLLVGPYISAYIFFRHNGLYYKLVAAIKSI